jgi:drug/metabolite transporter (DMT)-like permease
MTEKAGNIKAHIYMATAMVLFAIISPVGKLILDYIHPLTLNTLRLLGAAICFWITSFFVKEKVAKKDLFLLFFAALFGTMLNQGLFLIGLSKTNPIHSSLMTSTAPILTMIISAVYLKEKVTYKRITGILTGAGGAAMLILMNKQTGDYPSSIWGDIICLLAQLSYAIYLTFFLRLIKKYSPVTVSKWIFTYAFICYSIISFHDIVNDDVFSLPIGIWIRIFVIAIMCTYVTFNLMMTAQKSLSPTVVSTYSYFLPIIGAGISFSLGMGTLGVYAFVATALILLGVVLVSKSNTKS